MGFKRAVLCGMLLAAVPGMASAKMMTSRERLRAEAEHACYGDAQRLCPDAMPNEAKVTACMKVHRAQLSPACGKIFDRGMKG